MNDVAKPRHAWLLGETAHRRLRLRRTLIAAAVYLFFFAIQGYLVRIGGADGGLALVGAVTAFVGQAFFYVAIRSGWSERFGDPSMTMAQMVFAMVVIAFAYYIDAVIHGGLFMIVALVLVFGAFALPKRRCRQLGVIAVVLLAIPMLVGVVRKPAEFPLQIEVIQFLGMIVVLPTIGFLSGELSQLRLDHRHRRDELRDAIERLEALALHDEMTGLPNRRHVQEWIVHEQARHRRRGEAMCLAVIDLDHFKRVNDTYGHAIGDDVLRLFATEAHKVLRDADILARWGGEEFLLVMPETHLSAGRLALTRLREHMARASTWQALPTGPISFSAGLALLSGGQTMDDSLKRADDALYEAKRGGRDRVVEALAA